MIQGPGGAVKASSLVAVIVERGWTNGSGRALGSKQGRDLTQSRIFGFRRAQSAARFMMGNLSIKLQPSVAVENSAGVPQAIVLLSNLKPHIQ